MNDNITVVATKTLIAGLIELILEDESVEDITGMDFLTPKPCIRLLVMPDAAKCHKAWRESASSKKRSRSAGSGSISLQAQLFRAVQLHARHSLRRDLLCRRSAAGHGSAFRSQNFRQLRSMLDLENLQAL
jgi:hypothetical protein